MNKLLARATRILGVAICVGLFAAEFQLSGSLEYFVHIPSMIVMGSLMVGGMLVAFRFEELMLPAAILLADNTDQPEEKIKRALLVVDRAYSLAWASGFATFMLGLVTIIVNLFSPDTLGRGVAASSVPLLYGALLAEFIIAPLRSSVKCKALKIYPTAVVDSPKLNRSVAGFFITACLFLAIILALLFASYIPPRYS